MNRPRSALIKMESIDSRTAFPACYAIVWQHP